MFLYRLTPLSVPPHLRLFSTWIGAKIRITKKKKDCIENQIFPSYRNMGLLVPLKGSHRWRALTVLGIGTPGECKSTGWIFLTGVSVALIVHYVAL